MKKRTVVIRKKTCNWQPNTKRKIEIKETLQRKHNAGFISPVFVVMALTAFAGLFYLYSINQTATKGIEIKNVEKQIAQEKNENESLKIKEAELKSLYHIEESTKNLDMVDAVHVNYIEENPSVAFANNGKESKN